jgi:hypothetical protein
MLISGTAMIIFSAEPAVFVVKKGDNMLNPRESINLEIDFALHLLNTINKS